MVARDAVHAAAAQEREALTLLMKSGDLEQPEKGRTAHHHMVPNSWRVPRV